MSLIADQNQLFDDYRSGRTDALWELLESEKPHVFDFLLRMTGQYDKAIETTSELMDTIFAQKNTWENLRSHKIDLFKTARSFNVEIWGAKTNKLKNTAYEKILTDPSISPKKKSETLQKAKLDQHVSQLKSSYRESIILSTLNEFSTTDISKIMGTTSTVITTDLACALNILNNKNKTLPRDIKSHLRELSLHPMPDQTTQQMTDLHEVIGGIRRGIPFNLFRVLKTLLVLSLVGFILYLLIYRPEWFESYRIVLLQKSNELLK